jgi:hypothetical protein
VQINESEIICTTASLKTNNSSGYNGVSNKILRIYGQLLGKFLAYVFNNSLTQGIFQDCVK